MRWVELVDRIEEMYQLIDHHDRIEESSKLNGRNEEMIRMMVAFLGRIEGMYLLRVAFLDRILEIVPNDDHVHFHHFHYRYSRNLRYQLLLILFEQHPIFDLDYEYSILIEKKKIISRIKFKYLPLEAIVIICRQIMADRIVNK